MHSITAVEERIAEYKQWIADDLTYCEELFREKTIRLMACKYAYYKCDNAFIDDYAYDMEERDWYALGRALGKLTEEDTSPCVDFDPKHPLANEGNAMALRLMRKR